MEIEQKTGMQVQQTYSRRVNGTGLPLWNLWDDSIGMLVVKPVLLVAFCAMLQITLQLIMTSMLQIAAEPKIQFVRFLQFKARRYLNYARKVLYLFSPSW